MEPNSPQKIAIIGAGSMVGSRFCDLQNNYKLIKADLKGEIALDLTNQKSIETFYDKHEFNAAILFSAFTDVDAAEKQRGDKNGAAWKINVNGTKSVAKLASKFSRRLIFISTDFVFDGDNGPYDENDPRSQNMDKISWYGITKIKAEEAVEESRGHLIIRISYPYRAVFQQKEDFARSILRKSKEGTLHPMFNDQMFTPTFIDDIFPSIKLLIEKKQSGIFHVASPTITTPFEFARELIKTSGINPQMVKEGKIKEFMKKENSAPKPLKGGLKVEKITNLGFKPTDYKTGIKELFSQIGSH